MEPRKHTTNFSRGSAEEIISGMSCLSMMPDPIDPAKLTEDDRYLSETDYWAKHSMVHFREAIDCLNEVGKVKERLMMKITKVFEEIEKKGELEDADAKYSELMEILRIM